MDSVGGQGPDGTDGTGQQRTPSGPSFAGSNAPVDPRSTPTQGPMPAPDGAASPTHPATEASAPPTHAATELSPPQPTGTLPPDRTSTVPGRPRPNGPIPPAGQHGSRDQRTPETERPGGATGLHRYGPGVPAAGLGDRPFPTAEEVWRTGLPPGQSSRRGRWRRRAGTALTVVLLIAAGVVVYLRLHTNGF